MSKADMHKRYKARIEHAVSWRKQEGYDDLWRRLIDLYKGKQFPRSLTAEDRIAVNICFATINVIAPSVSMNHPKITVMAAKPEDEDRATIIEAVLDYQWKHHNFLLPTKDAIKDALILGIGYTKTTWKFKEVEQPLSEEASAAAYDQLNQQADEFAGANPELAHAVPTPAEVEANIPSTEMTIVEDRPTVERISPWDLFWDVLATRAEDATWVAQRIIRPLDEAKADKRYSPSVRKQLKGDTALRDPRDTQRTDMRRAGESEEMYVTIWEYYDIKNSTLSVCADSGDDFLIDPTPIPYSFGHPFQCFRNYDVPDQFYPMGELEAIEPLQDELNKTRSMMMNARKRYARKYLYYERAFGPEGRAALESDVDNTMVPVTDDNRPLQETVMPMPQTPLAPEVYQYSEQITSDVDRITGISEYQRGAISEIRRTATEASMIQDAANARASEKLSIVERGIAMIARCVIALNQQYMTGEQVARVVGPSAKQFWFNYKREDLTGEYDFTVEAGSTQPMNETVRRQQAIAMMNAMEPFLGTVVDPKAMAIYALQHGFGVRNPERFLVQAPPPQSPSERIIESINYKDVPPDIQRQMEVQAGFEASQMAGMSPSQPVDASGQAQQPQAAAPQQGQMAQPEPNLANGQPIPPEILAQLQGQLGLNVNSLQGTAQ